ncbi:transporter [Streptomyces sp. NPDC029554]|uniref:solute symporter family protein n=1 Tax=Streptomyces sp. NPDC029554 TaxID=3155126 RepID=UPI0033D1C54B
MHMEVLSLGGFDSFGADVRRPVIIAFLFFIGCSLLWASVLVTAQENSPERLYVANRSLSPVLNGFAMAGEQITAVSLLAIPGAIVLLGYDGVIVAIDALIGLGIALLFTQKIRNSGCYTLGDIFGLRASGRAPGIAAALVTLTISIPVILIQIRAIGIGVSLLIGASTAQSQVICTVAVGFLVACFAAVADLRGTTFIHVVKVPLTLMAMALVTLLALKQFEWDPASLLSAAVNGSAVPDKYLSPGMWPYATVLGPLDDVAAHAVAVLGTAVAPHLILRINASRTGQSARRSMSIAVTLTGAFIALLITAGLAATAVVGTDRIAQIDGNGQSALFLLASEVLDDGSTARVALITTIACVTFLGVLTSVSSVTFAAGVSLAHDVFVQHRRRHTETSEFLVLRLTVVILCAVGLSLSAATHLLQVEFLITFALSVAASCILPALIYSFFWRRFNGRGLLWSVYGGLLLCTILVVFSPSVSGSPHALWPEVNFAWYPFQTPGLVSVPAAFLIGWIGSVTSPGNSQRDFAALEYTLLTGRHPGQTPVSHKQ